MGVIFENPIALAHFTARGGWKTALTTLGGYAVLVVGGIVISCSMNSAHPLSPLGNWSTMLLVLQLIFCVLVGPLLLTSMVQQDRTSGMVESHRLMPINGLVAVVGYLLGMGRTFLLMGVFNVAVGCLTSGLGGLDVGTWLTANAIMLSFGLFIWVLATVGSMGSKGVGLLTFLLMLVTFMSQGTLLWFVPALMLVCTPMMGGSVFQFRAGVDMSGVGCGLVAQILICWIAVVIAVRKFRRPDAPVVGPVFALLMLALVVMMNLTAIAQWDWIAWSASANVMRENLRLQQQFVSSVVLVSLVSAAPLASGFRRARRMGFLARLGLRVGMVLICLALVELLLVVPGSLLREHRGAQIGVASASAALMVVEVACFVQAMPGKGVRRLALMLVFPLVWVGPVALDGITATSDEVYWEIGQYSPIITLAAPWMPYQPERKGLIGQAVVAGGFLVWAMGSSAVRKREEDDLLDVGAGVAVA